MVGAVRPRKGSPYVTLEADRPSDSPSQLGIIQFAPILSQSTPVQGADLIAQGDGVSA